jgi:hypothetical protein
VRRSVNSATLKALREMPSAEALVLLAVHAKMDAAYAPIKDARSRRWHASTTCGDFEILTTGAKWWDTRARKGGGGAIDLAMHLLQLSFVEAVQLLTERQLSRG